MISTTITKLIKKPFVYKLWSAVFALLVWQAVAMLIGSNVIFASPAQTAIKLFEIVCSDGFVRIIIFSFIRIFIGFFSGLFLGVLLALLSNRSRLIQSMVWPFMSAIKSVPVASFIIISLVWFSSKSVSAFISFLIVLPIIYTNILQGLKSSDKKLSQVSQMFCFSRTTKLIYVNFLELKPYILSACTVACALAFKSGIAAEIIGIPSGSVGERLYQAKLYINTPELFAWTVIIVIISIICEKIFISFIKLIFKKIEKGVFLKWT